MPSSGAFGQSIIALTFNNLQLSDSFAPENWQKLNRDDLDFGSASPVTFPFEGWNLLAAAGKESVVYLLSIPNAKASTVRRRRASLKQRDTLVPLASLGK